MTKDKFWLYNPLILLTDFKLIPSETMTLDEKLNAFTTIIFIITIIMILYDNAYWYIFLILGILIVFIIKIMCDQKNDQEGFSIPPTYIDGAEPLTTVPPLFAEEWQVPPPIYDEYTNAPSPEGKCLEYTEDRPIFGQYITSSRLFPYQNDQLQNIPLNDAQLYMTSEFDRDSLRFRNDMTRGFVNKLDRWYRSGNYDTISSYNSY